MLIYLQEMIGLAQRQGKALHAALAAFLKQKG
jgi:hypothetical protein